MKQFSGKQFAKLVERHGWNLLRISGSTVRLSIPVHASQPLKRGLLAHLAKLAGLEESDLT